MKQTRSNLTQKILFCIIVVLVAVIVILLLKFTCGGQMVENRHTDTPVEKNENSIAIPGFEMLELKANTKEQPISLSNPPQNMCYFRITLYLENGDILWTSELIKPGKNSKPIVLEEPLCAGTYSNAILKYECFRMDKNRSPLNGAETKLTLLVK